MNQDQTVWDRSAWTRGFILALAYDYRANGGNGVKLIQNRAYIADLISGHTKGRADLDFDYSHQIMAEKWIEAGGTIFDWNGWFRDLLAEVTR